MSGKGSKPRPFSVPYEKYSENWDKIFGKTKENDKNKQEIVPKNQYHSKNEQNT